MHDDHRCSSALMVPDPARLLATATTDNGQRTNGQTDQTGFTCLARDPDSAARLGRLETPHGVVETPAFMPVGTQATVKGITPEQLRATGSRMILANTFHLALRPGEDVVAALGGLHAFMGWDGPILTDSGGFQVFSLAARNRVRDHGVSFRSHLDGRLLELTPERATSIQEALGADVAMCLDHCPSLPASESVLCDAVERTIAWARRCKAAHTRRDQALFGIVQGGAHAGLRARCAEELVALDFDGYAIGGVSVGEGHAEIRQALAVTTHLLPEDRPRYLMGVGRPQDLLDAVATGVDLFDCVLPTRNGRNATCFTAKGCVKLRNAAHRRDPRPIEDGCDCLACGRFSRSYLRHLFLAKEMLGPILASIHNLTYLHRLTRRIRAAIAEGWFVQLRREVLEALGP
jgi:queuine tRNA-ribosyltransferase